MRWDSVKDMNCSVARTLSVVGERWTMLILREAFLGRHRFDEFQQGTGIARNILSSRLRDLVRDGIFDRARSEGDSGRVEYRLTRKGLELYPVLIAMMRWGDTWLSDESRPADDADPSRLRREDRAGHGLFALRRPSDRARSRRDSAPPGARARPSPERPERKRAPVNSSRLARRASLRHNIRST